ncbi:MAG: Ig-like domain-containing protein [Acidobacteria bacterium]|nr:Ig-like domain-containing protein [Acidobacteriota bacterium]
MTRMFLSSLFIVCAFATSAFPGEPQPAARAGALTVVSAGPTGETASLAEANEIRVVFSEPMVTLGRIPTPVRAEFFRVAPAVAGTFRWSGATMLIFTPDPKRPLPYATRYEVTVDTTATAVRGRRLAQPYRFSFTTPTVKLLQTNWYRRGGRAGAQMVVLLRFNQPVRSADVAAHVSARFEPHQWDPPILAPNIGACRLLPATARPRRNRRSRSRRSRPSSSMDSTAPLDAIRTAGILFCCEAP